MATQSPLQNTPLDAILSFTETDSALEFTTGNVRSGRIAVYTFVAINLCVFAYIACTQQFLCAVAALLAELFPPRIRYSSLSIPYHIGTGYFGGFLPYISQYIVARTGDAYSGLWYMVGVTAMAFVVALIWLPETSGKEVLD